MAHGKARAAIMIFHGQSDTADSAGCSRGLEPASDKKAHRAAVRRHNVGLQSIESHVPRQPDEGFQQEPANSSTLIGINDA